MSLILSSLFEIMRIINTSKILAFKRRFPLQKIPLTFAYELCDTCGMRFSRLKSRNKRAEINLLTYVCLKNSIFFFLKGKKFIVA